jgi:D-glycero-D-manno-heptose 1,7-bisphosphate phosphatase
MRAYKRTTVFLDRDGTINLNLPFPNVNRPDKLSLLPRAAEGIRLLNDHGCRVVVVTNQAGIGNPENDLTAEEFRRITERLSAMLRETAGASVEDTFCCMHVRDDNCECRKPAPGLLRQAKGKYPEIVLEESYIVGDRPDDILAGRSLGLKTVLVLTGHGTSSLTELEAMGVKVDYTAQDLHEAAGWIVGRL